MDDIYSERMNNLQTDLKKLLTTPRNLFVDSTPPAPVPGLYVIYEESEIVYLGSAQNLRLRVWREHLLGEKVRPAGSQFRGVLRRARALENEDEVTEYIRKRLSFAVLEKDPIHKRELHFLENFCKAVIQPEFIEWGSRDTFWFSKQLEKLFRDFEKQQKAGE